MIELFDKIKNKLRKRKGGSTILEIVISAVVVVFILFYPTVIYGITQKKSDIQDVLMVGLQAVALEGGLSANAKTVIDNNLKAKGLYSDDVIIEVKCDTNNDGTEENCTGGNLIYLHDENPVLRLKIWIPATNDLKVLNSVMGLLGSTDGSKAFPINGATMKHYYVSQGYVLSEKVSY